MPLLNTALLPERTPLTFKSDENNPVLADMPLLKIPVLAESVPLTLTPLVKTPLFAERTPLTLSPDAKIPVRATILSNSYLSKYSSNPEVLLMGKYPISLAHAGYLQKFCLRWVESFGSCFAACFKWHLAGP